MRWVRAIAFAFVVSFVVSVGAAAPADAAPKWCEDDPIVVIQRADGTWTWSQIVTKFAYADLPSVTGPLVYDIHVPEEHSGKTFIYLPPSPVAKTVNLHWLPATYFPDWSDATKVKIEVRMYVPAATTFATLSEVTGNLKKGFTVRGRSNELTIFHVSMH